MATENNNTDWEAKRKALEAIGVKSEVLVANQKEKASNGELQYTLFASGLNHGRGSELESKNTTNDLAVIFDSVSKHTYSKGYNKTSYAVESKSKASDNVTTQDGKFTFSGIISDAPYLIDKRNYIDRDTDKDNPVASKRPSKALEILQTIADSHQLVTLVTEDNILTSYVITNLDFDRSSDTGSALTASVSLEEFRFKNVSKTVLVNSSAKKSKNKNSGTKQTAKDGTVDDATKGKRKTPYLGKNAETKEQWEHDMAGTEDFSGEAGKKFEFDPNSLKR